MITILHYIFYSLIQFKFLKGIDKEWLNLIILSIYICILTLINIALLNSYNISNLQYVFAFI